jgi:hypothetical protein
MSELERRKKLLVAEAEVYRDLLKLEFYNLRIYGIKAKRKLGSFNPSSNPLLMAGLPLLSSLFYRRKRQFNWKSLSALVMFGFQLYSRFGSLFRRSSSRETDRTQPTAAEDYLSRSI